MKETPSVYGESDFREVSGGDVTLTDLIVTLWKQKWIVVAVTVVFAVASVTYALLKRPLYTATATIVPVGSSNQSSTLSQYAALASTFGVTLPSFSSGGTAPGQEIMAILQSRTLCEQLVRDLDLTPLIVTDPKSLGNEDPFQYAVEKLRTKDLKASDDSKTGLISIAVTFSDKRKAMQIANRAVQVLESILNKQNAVLGKQSTRSLEEQITQQSNKVQQLQNQLASFQKSTKIISPQGQVSSAVSLYGDLLQQKLTLEVSLSRLENALSPDNPQVTAAKAQLQAVDEQISKLEGTTGVGSFSMSNAPDQMVKYQNISGELDVASKIYAGLLAAYENQKLQQAQNQIFVQVIDPAILPYRPSHPKKKLVAIAGTLAGLLAGILAAFAAGTLPNVRQDFKLRLSADSGERHSRTAMRNDDVRGFEE